MAIVERVALQLLRVVARRWPPGMLEEWSAELAALRGRPWRMLTFAGSLAATPAAWSSHAATAVWSSHAAAAGAATLVVLLAAGLFNGVHLALHRVETQLPWSGEAFLVTTLLALSVLLMAVAGTRRRPSRPLRSTLLIGAAAGAFLFAGNETAVMPFMGWRDVTPAVAVWVTLTALSGGVALRLRAAGRTGRAALLAVGGGLLAVHAATTCGSLHAAAELGVPAHSAPAWFPLAMLPGGTGGFGTYFADGQAAFGGLHSSGPAFHGSDILLANAAAISGPLLLCTAFLAAAFLTPPRPATQGRAISHAGPASSRTLLRAVPAGAAPSRTLLRAAPASAFLARPCRRLFAQLRGRLLSQPCHRLFAQFRGRLLTQPCRRLFAQLRSRFDPMIVAACATAAGTLLLAECLPRAATTADLILPRIIDNSSLFGFGFLASPAGRAALALAVALLVAHHLATHTERPA